MQHSVPRTCPPYAENLFTDPLLVSGWLVADRVATRLGVVGERAGSATILKGGCIGRASPQRNSPRCIGLIGNHLLTDPALSSRRLLAAWIATPLARAAYPRRSLPRAVGRLGSGGHAARRGSARACPSIRSATRDARGGGTIAMAQQLFGPYGCRSWPRGGGSRSSGAACAGQLAWQSRPCVPRRGRRAGAPIR